MTRSLTLIGAMVVAAALLGAGPAAADELPPGGTFTDDNGSQHEGNIEAIAAAGITKGCNPPANDRYCPDDPVTRGQMAAFLVRARGYTETGDTDFVDDGGSVFEADISKLAAAGVTKGCNPPANDRYCPSHFVTRGQMAAFLVRAFGYTDTGDVDFVDDDISIFETDINKLAAAGVTAGCNPPANDRYCPDEPVTRSQMASFLARALDLDPITPPPPPEVPTDVTAVGDSVMLGATALYCGSLPEIIPGIAVDAVVSRQFWEGDDVLAAKRAAGTLDPHVVIHLGTNAAASDSGFDDMMDELVDTVRVVFVNVAVPRSWEATSNAVIAAGVDRYGTAVLVDWHATVAAHPELVRDDGFHLTCEGADAYSELIAAALTQ